MSKVKLTNECWVWIGASTKKGYGVMWLDGRLAGATTVALMLADVEKTGPFVLHSCDNIKCVRPSHLRWGTAKENTADMIRRGRAGWETHPETFRRLAREMRVKHYPDAKQHRTTTP